MAEKQRGVSRAAELELPSNLKVRRTVQQGNGIFTTKAISPVGTEIFTSKPYAFAISGVTLDDVKSMCSHCLVSIRFCPVECTKCKAVGYCSKECQRAASQLHTMECEGLLELEKLRGKKDLKHQPPLPSNQPQQAHMWPPTVAVITARALNRKVLQTKEKWGMNYLARLTTTTTIKDAFFVKPYAKPLLHESVSSDDDICDAFCKVAANYVHVGMGNVSRVSAIAVYLEYSLLNHSCRPTCSYASANQTMSVYALTNIQRNDQLCISYLSRETMLLHGTARRENLLKNFRFKCSCSTCLDEAEPGSKSWLLDQKKKSFIVPWTQDTANGIMDEGLKDLEKIECVTSEENWAEVVEIASTTLKKIGRFLSKNNIVYIRTSLSLMNALERMHFEKVHEALELAESLLPYIKEYDSAEGIGAHLARMSWYSFSVGETQQALKYFQDSMNLFPRNLNNEGYLSKALIEAKKVGGSSIAKLIDSKLKGLTIY